MYKPPYKITSHILNLVADIQSFIAEAEVIRIAKPNLKLRKENKIKTIHHSLAIEGNTLSEAQISTLLEGKRVFGPQNQIQEVKNAIILYDKLGELDPSKESNLLKAHKILMQGLIDKPGQYRNKAVGIFKGGKVSRMAPPHKNVSNLMKDLFKFIEKDKETHPLLKACIFHYELEFIHPFEDGNGRMGRLWQQLLLMRFAEIFEFIPIESLIHQNQKEYYRALEVSDKEGESTKFIEFSLKMIIQSLKNYSRPILTSKPKASDRIDKALKEFSSQSFTRKEYMSLHKGISSATASRDLAEAVREKLITVSGTKAKAMYRVKK